MARNPAGEAKRNEVEQGGTRKEQKLGVKGVRVNEKECSWRTRTMVRKEEKEREVSTEREFWE